MNAISEPELDRKSTRLNSSHLGISYAVFCLKKNKSADDRQAPGAAAADAGLASRAVLCPPRRSSFLRPTAAARKVGDKISVFFFFFLRRPAPPELSFPPHPPPPPA